MKAKGADPVQARIIDQVKEALQNDPENVEMEADSIPFINEANISSHLGSDKSLQDVLEMMIEKLRKNMKTVDSQKKPQIIMLTQDTLKVAELYKNLRDKYPIGATCRVSKHKKQSQPNQIEIRLHKLFARHIAMKE